MMRPGRWLWALGLAWGLVGCGSPRPEDPVADWITQWEKAAQTLEGVTDEASLEDARKKLETIGQKMAELNNKAAAQELDPGQRAQLERDHRTRSAAALKRYNEAARKVRTLPGAEKILIGFRRTAMSTVGR